MSFKKQHPMDIVHRCLAIELLRSIGAKDVFELNPNLVTVYNEVDDEGIEHEMFELDYEFLLFECHIFQIEKAIKKFEETKPEQVSSLIGINGEKLVYTKTPKEDAN